MDKIKQLELNKLFKELDFIQSDHDYKNEIISSTESDFLTGVSKFLEKNPQLKELYDKKIQERIDDILKKQEPKPEDVQIVNEDQINQDNKDKDNSEEEIDKIENKEEEIVESEKDNKLKSIYRQIVKLTHPDRVSDKRLNNLYVKATDFYDKKDIIGLYSISTELGINIDYNELSLDDLKSKITTIKDRIAFMESTLTWKWYYSQDEGEKLNLIFLFIRTQLAQ